MAIIDQPLLRFDFHIGQLGDGLFLSFQIVFRQHKSKAKIFSTEECKTCRLKPRPSQITPNASCKYNFSPMCLCICANVCEPNSNCQSELSFVDVNNFYSCCTSVSQIICTVLPSWGVELDKKERQRTFGKIAQYIYPVDITSSSPHSRAPTVLSSASEILALWKAGNQGCQEGATCPKPSTY